MCRLFVAFFPLPFEWRIWARAEVFFLSFQSSNPAKYSILLKILASNTYFIHHKLAGTKIVIEYLIHQIQFGFIFRSKNKICSKCIGFANIRIFMPSIRIWKHTKRHEEKIMRVKKREWKSQDFYADEGCNGFLNTKKKDFKYFLRVDVLLEIFAIMRQTLFSSLQLKIYFRTLFNV